MPRPTPTRAGQRHTHGDGDRNHDDYEPTRGGSPTTARRPTTTEPPTTEAQSLDIAAMGPVCQSDAPYIDVTFGDQPQFNGRTATVTFIDLDGNVVGTETATMRPATVRFVYPGATVDASGNPLDWPGWMYQRPCGWSTRRTPTCVTGSRSSSRSTRRRRRWSVIRRRRRDAMRRWSLAGPTPPTSASVDDACADDDRTRRPQRRPTGHQVANGSLTRGGRWASGPSHHQLTLSRAPGPMPSSSSARTVPPMP